MEKTSWDWTLKRRLRFHLRRAIRHRPALYLPLSRLRSRPHMIVDGVEMLHTAVVSEDTEIVIEGLYRCANTFAVVAFQLAQDRPRRIAHHLHAEAQIIRGVELGLPVVLLLRHPEDVAVSSSASFGLPLKQVLRDYILFYERVLLYRSHLLTATFETVTSDFGRVIKAVNSRFGTDFGVFQHTPSNVKRCYHIIDEFYRRTARDPQRTIAHPSRKRNLDKEYLRAAYLSHAYTDLRRKASHLYDALAQHEYVF